MEDQYGDWGQPLRDGILAYAVGSSLLLTGVTLITLVHLGLPFIPTGVGVGVLGVIFSFTATPHIVARWLDIEVTTLLELDDEQPNTRQHSTRLNQNHSK